MNSQTEEREAETRGQTNVNKGGASMCRFGCYRGVHPPWDHDVFPPPVSDFPLFSKKIRTLRTILTILPFPEKFLDFPRNFWWPFFNHRPQISNFTPIFAVSVHFPLLHENYSFPPTLTKFPPVLHKFTCFLYTLRVFRFPLLLPWCIYASPNARTGRSWAVGGTRGDSRLFILGETCLRDLLGRLVFAYKHIYICIHKCIKALYHFYFFSIISIVLRECCIINRCWNHIGYSWS